MNVEGRISRRSFSLSVLGAGVSTSMDGSQFESDGDQPIWSSFQGDSRNSGVTDNAGPRESAFIDWTAELNGPLWGSPVVYDDMLSVVDSGGTVYGFDTGSGTQEWSYEMVDGFPVPLALLGETVIVAKREAPSKLVGVDVKSGEIRWQRSIEEGSPNGSTVANGSIFNTTTSGLLAAYTSEGEQRWQVDIGHRIRTVPAVDDGTVVVGSVGGVHAVDAETGKRSWDYPIETSPTFILGSSPTIADGTVFHCGGQGDRSRIVGIDLGEGTEQFEYQTEIALDASPAVTESHLVVGDLNHLFALDWREGTELWRREYDLTGTDGESGLAGRARQSSPVISGDTVYVGAQNRQENEGGVYGLSLDTGQTKWVSEFENRVHTSPVVVGGRLFIGDHGGTLYALSEDDGSSLKEFGLTGGALVALGGGAYAAWRRWGRDSSTGDS